MAFLICLQLPTCSKILPEPTAKTTLLCTVGFDFLPPHMYVPTETNNNNMPVKFRSSRAVCSAAGASEERRPTPSQFTFQPIPVVGGRDASVRFSLLPGLPGCGSLPLRRTCHAQRQPSASRATTDALSSSFSLLGLPPLRISLAVSPCQQQVESRRICGDREEARKLVGWSVYAQDQRSLIRPSASISQCLVRRVYLPLPPVRSFMSLSPSPACVETRAECEWKQKNRLAWWKQGSKNIINIVLCVTVLYGFAECISVVVVKVDGDDGD